MLSLRTITLNDYLTLAAQAGRTVVPQHNALWVCMNCAGSDPYGRKRSDCPTCRGNGGVHAPSPSVARDVPPQQQWGASAQDRYQNLRDAQWAQMAELLRRYRK